MYQSMNRALVAAVALIAASWAQAQEAGVVRLKPEMDAVVSPDAKPELLRGGFKKGLEGGVWVRNGGYLLFSNKPEQVINRWTPDGQLSVYLNLVPYVKPPGTRVTMASGMVLDREGRLVYCSAGEQAVIRVEADGSRTVLADSYEGKRLTHPNDLTYKADGTLYFTDQGDPPPGRTAELTFSGAYMLREGKLRRVAEQLPRPNGLAVSADERFLFISDSEERKLWRFEILPDGSTGKGEPVIETGRAGSVDGMRVDKAGRLYLGLPGGVWVLSPEGTQLGVIAVPDRVSNLAFGDADAKTLYMMNHTTLYKIRLNAEGLQRW